MHQEFELGKRFELPVLDFGQPPRYTSTPARDPVGEPAELRDPKDDRAECVRRERPFNFTLTPHMSPHRPSISLRSSESTFEYARPRKHAPQGHQSVPEVAPEAAPEATPQGESEAPQTAYKAPPPMRTPMDTEPRFRRARDPSQPNEEPIFQPHRAQVQPKAQPQAQGLPTTRPREQPPVQPAPTKHQQTVQPIQQPVQPAQAASQAASQPPPHAIPDLSTSGLDASFQTPPPRPQQREREIKWQPQMWVRLAKMCNLFPPLDNGVPPQIRREFSWMSEAELKTRLAVLKKWDSMQP